MVDVASEGTGGLIHPFGLAVPFLLLAATGVILLARFQPALGGVDQAHAPVLSGPAAISPRVSRPPNEHVSQTNSGVGSSNMQGFQCDVIITIDQGSGRTATTQAQEPAAQ